MPKRVTIKAKPTTKQPARSADEWVARGAASPSSSAAEPEQPKPEKVPTTRYTIDIPTALHAQIKSKCAARGKKMNEEVVRLLEKEFSD